MIPVSQGSDQYDAAAEFKAESHPPYQDNVMNPFHLRIEWRK
jgi:hypothetical protein